MTIKKLNVRRSISKRVVIAGTLLFGVLFFYIAVNATFFPRNDKSVEISNKPVVYNFSKPQQQNVPPREIDKTNKTPTDLGDNALGIPELGIKFTVPEELKDLVYYPNDIDNHKFVYFSTATLTNSGHYCAASGAPLGSFSKVNKSEVSKTHADTDHWMYQEESLKKYSQEWSDEPSGQKRPPMVKELEEFYIVFTGPHATCSDDKTVQDLQSSQIRMLYSVISTVENL